MFLSGSIHKELNNGKLEERGREETLAIKCVTFWNTNLWSVHALYHEYFKLCIPLEPVIPLLRIPGINQSVLYNFENGKWPGCLARENCLYLLGLFQLLPLNHVVEEYLVLCGNVHTT